MADPVMVLTVNQLVGGVVTPVALDFAAGQFVPLEWLAHASDRAPQLTIQVPAAESAGPDAWLGRVATLSIDGDVYFKGPFIDRRVSYSAELGGRVLEYDAVGDASELDNVPVRSDLDGTTTLRYNLDPRDRDQLDSRSGRTVGQIVLHALEQDLTVAALAARGLGGYVTTGKGASATTGIVNGQVDATVSNLAGGSGYLDAAGNPAPPTVLAVGGWPTAAATYTATVNAAGVVTGVACTGRGSGYQAPPTLVFSRLPAATIADLYAGVMGTMIDQRPITVGGDKLGAALAGLLRPRCPNHHIWVDPQTGAIRVMDVRAYTARDVTMGDPADPRWDPASLRLAHSLQECRSRIEVIGAAYQELKVLRESRGELVKRFDGGGRTSAQVQATWKLPDWRDPSRPGGQALANPSMNSGVMTGATSQNDGFGYTPSTTVPVTVARGSGDTTGSGASLVGNVDSSGQIKTYSIVTGGSGYTALPILTVPPPDNGPVQRVAGTIQVLDNRTVRLAPTGGFSTTLGWAAGAWDWTSSGRRGTLNLTYSAGAGLTRTTTRKTIAHPAMAPGSGHYCDFTLDFDLDILAYDLGELFGEANGNSLGWRRWGVADPALARSMSRYFSRPVALPNAAGNAASLSTAPEVRGEGVGQIPEQSVPFSIDPDSGTFTLDVPIVTLGGTTAKLNLGGPDVDGVPADVVFYGSFNTGKLRVALPADDAGGAPQHEGLAYTLGYYEPSRGPLTWVYPVEDWSDPAGKAHVELLARELLDSVKDPAVEGTINYRGLDVTLLRPGVSVRLKGQDFPTEYESLALPVVEVSVRFNGRRGGGTLFDTSVRVSSRRAPYSAELISLPHAAGGTLDFDLGDAFGPGLLGGGWGSHGPNNHAVDFGPTPAFEAPRFEEARPFEVRPFEPVKPFETPGF